MALSPNILASGAPTCLKDEPLLFTSSACNAAASTAPFNWTSPNYPTPLVRHRDLALNTCNGCHTSETNTNFTHIGTSKMGSGEFTLSRFLTGKNSVEALNNPTLFNNLALFTATTFDGLQPQFNDIARRQDAMADIVGMSCGHIGLPFAGVSSTNFLAIH